MDMQIHNGDTLVVTLTGDTNPWVREEVVTMARKLLRPEIVRLVLDLSQVTWIDSSILDTQQYKSNLRLSFVDFIIPADDAGSQYIITVLRKYGVFPLESIVFDSRQQFEEQFCLGNKPLGNG